MHDKFYEIHKINNPKVVLQRGCFLSFFSTRGMPPPSIPALSKSILKTPHRQINNIKNLIFTTGGLKINVKLNKYKVIKVCAQPK